MIYEKFALPERCVGQTLHVATTLKQFAHTVAQKTIPLLHQAVGIYILSIEQIKYKLLTIKKVREIISDQKLNSLCRFITVINFM